MKQLFRVVVLFVVLGCVAFVLWQMIVKSDSPAGQPVTQNQSDDVVDHAVVESANTQSVSAEESVLENTETEVVTEPKVDQVMVEQSTPATTSLVTESNLGPRKEQLLAERRALVQVAYDQDPDVSPDILEAIRNPSTALLDVIIEEYIAGNLTFDEIETDFLIINDWFDDPLFAYLEEQGPFKLSGLRQEPLPEPAGYRNPVSQTRRDETGNIIRYEVAANADSTIEVYAVGQDGEFSGIVRINEDLQIPYREIRDVEPSSFVGDYGISIDPGAPDEFNLMLRGTDYGMAILYYSIYHEGETTTFTLPLITTPNMIASATWVAGNGRVDLYQWRVDYDGDGLVDFLISHNEMTEQQATDILDFVSPLLDLNDEDRQLFIENREGLVEYLTSEVYRNRD